MTDGRASTTRIVLAAGGTGGHVYPALSVAEQLQRLCPEVALLFVGGNRMEARVVPAAGLRFRAISVHGLAGRGFGDLPRRARSMAELVIGIPLLQSTSILASFRPQAVLGAGGYVSGPVILAAKLMGIPSLALEGNRTPGLTSRLVARLVDVLAVAWPEQEARFRRRATRRTRVVLTGLPIRADVVRMTRQEGRARLGLAPQRPVLLILGGSLGSRRINEAVVGALRILAARPEPKEWQILHVTGARNPVSLSPEEIAAVAPHYRTAAYLDQEYGVALAAADLVVTRAGASTIAELTARGLPAVIIPWSQAAAGEQVQNAEPLARAGAAVVILDAELTPNRFADALADLLTNEDKRRSMGEASRRLGRPHAAEVVAKLTLGLAGR